MTKGTTPTYILSFKETIDFSTVVYWTVTMKQGTVIHNIDDPIVDAAESTLTIVLTQQQTLQFTTGEASLQVKGKFSDGTVFASDIQRVHVNPILDERVIQ